MYQEYPGLMAEAGMKLSAAAATGSSLSFMVGRVSYTFGLQGGCGCAAACFCSTCMVVTCTVWGGQ